MTKYFGTDGIRGKANETLTVETAFKVGRYLGYYYSKIKNQPKILLGKDTRLSSSMFESAIACGASSTGADVYLVGYCPTPCISYNVANKDFVCGVMISASHNPYYDNGIKIFDSNGYKLAADIENEIESYIDDQVIVDSVIGHDIGQVINYTEALDDYLDSLYKMFDFRLEGFQLAVDCANGSASVTAEKLLKRMGATCTIMSDQPDGININNNCGSTHIEKLRKFMMNEEYDLGLAFDGDADRLIAIAPGGRIIDGDHILYICGQYMQSQGKLNHNTLVTTVMANLGLLKALDKVGINYDKTAVGDKYVFESMKNNHYVLGGEQSGHVIFSDLAVSGDGLLTALKLLEVMYATKKSIAELCKELYIFPQLLVNQVVEDKNSALNDVDINLKIDDISKALGSDGRILVRPSGTEALVRVMVEAKSDELCHKYVYEVIDLIKQKKL